MKNKGLFVLFALSLLIFGCAKYGKYDNMQVVENNFTGNVLITSSGQDPAGDFTGTGDSGTYSFAWDNSKKKALANFDITSNSGSVQLIINDAKGNEVLNQTLTGGTAPDTFSGISAEGKEGMWLITLNLTNFNGDGSFSIMPAD